jgi:hypothetical protein
VIRLTTCGKPGCRCQGDPPQRHGPYYQWNRAVAGKTVSRRLGEREAELYRSWIANRRRLEQIVAQMEQTSAGAGELLLRQTDASKLPGQRSADQDKWGPNGRREVRNVTTNRGPCGKRIAHPLGVQESACSGWFE